MDDLDTSYAELNSTISGHRVRIYPANVRFRGLAVTTLNLALFEQAGGVGRRQPQLIAFELEAKISSSPAVAGTVLSLSAPDEESPVLTV